MTLKELAHAAEVWSKPSEIPLVEEDVYSLLTKPLAQLSAPRNAALDLGIETNGHWIRRASTLNHSIRIEGKYLIVNYCPHDPTLTLWIFEKEQDIEDYLVSARGPLNAFCEYAIPFIDGKTRDYNLYFETHGRREEFRFGKEFKKLREFGLKPQNCRLEWQPNQRHI